jgi:hypothetical protein
MVSIWWLLIAFIGGGWLGMLLFALMQMTRDQPRQSSPAPVESVLESWSS